MRGSWKSPEGLQILWSYQDCCDKAEFCSPCLCCCVFLGWNGPCPSTPLLLQGPNQMPAWGDSPSKHSCTQRDQGTWKVNKMVVLGLGCSLWLSTSSNSWNCDFIVFGYGLSLGIFKSTLPHNPGKNENITQEDIYFQLCQSKDYLFLSPF